MLGGRNPTPHFSRDETSMAWSRNDKSYRELLTWASTPRPGDLGGAIEIVGRIDRKHITMRRIHPEVLADYYNRDAPAPAHLNVRTCFEVQLNFSADEDVPLCLSIDGDVPEIWLVRHKWPGDQRYSLACCGLDEDTDGMDIGCALEIDDADVAAIFAKLEPEA